MTALDFSRYQPNILAVGLYDGTVAVYDVKVRVGQCVPCDGTLNGSVTGHAIHGQQTCGQLGTPALFQRLHAHTAR